MSECLSIDSTHVRRFAKSSVCLSVDAVCCVHCCVGGIFRAPKGTINAFFNLSGTLARVDHSDRDSGFVSEPGITVIDMPHVPQGLEAIIYTLPLQMLSYHVALLKGTDVDQPRNLAKSVTVE